MSPSRRATRASEPAANNLGPLAAIRNSLGMLTEAERRKYALLVAGQMALSVLDVLGVLLIGAVGALAVAGSQSDELPEGMSRILSVLGIAEWSALQVAGLAALAAVVLLAAKSALYALFLRSIFRFLARCQREVVDRSIRTLLRMSYLTTGQRSSQELAHGVITSSFFAITAVLAGASMLLSELSVLTLLTGVLLLFDPAATVSMLVFFLLLAIAMQYGLGRTSSELGKGRADGTVESSILLQECLAASREIHALHREDYFERTLRGITGRLSGVAARSLLINEIPKLVYEAALVAGVLVLAAWQLTTQDLATAIGTLSLFLAAGFRVVPTLVRLNSQLISIRGLGAQVRDFVTLEEELRTASMPRTTAAPDRHAPEFRPEIVLESVTFTYPGGDQAAVENVTLSVPPGASLAGVGRSGAGKSTLADLVLGVLEPDAGTLLVGGRPPAAAIGTWPGSLAYVPQAVTLFNASIRANVLMGLEDPSVDDSAIYDVLALVDLADHVFQLPDGLNTLVGERGFRLSGGQRQRLGLARALLTRPRLLVLDEATSALDRETEARIEETLEALHGEVTTMVIAHRIATIKLADSIALIDAGRCQVLPAFEALVDHVGWHPGSDLLRLRP